jgi:hypothetical protein
MGLTAGSALVAMKHRPWSTKVRTSLYKALMKIIKDLCQDIWYKIKTGITNFLNGRQLHILSLGGTSMTDVLAVGHLPDIRNRCSHDITLGFIL